ncbi:MAG: GntR family transcriptional regulator [Gemmatimonadaceae bacterium]|nr:GntR family transcriptional regulator [Gemmatimonadaceae bacterium]
MSRIAPPSSLFDGTPASDADVYQRLLDLVVRGELVPGSRLTEPMVAERLDVSRTPAREAMHRLQLEGLLIPDGGGERPRVAVAPLDAPEAREVYRTTGLLESAAARAAADMPGSARSTLARSLARFDKAFRTEAARTDADATVLFTNHHGFHQLIAERCAGPVTQMLLQALHPRRARYEWFHAPLVQTAGQSFDRTYQEHDAIVEAIASGSASQIEQAVRRNWHKAADRLAAAIQHLQKTETEKKRPR